jgi:hypothetical protein
MHYLGLPNADNLPQAGSAAQQIEALSFPRSVNDLRVESKEIFVFEKSHHPVRNANSRRPDQPGQHSFRSALSKRRYQVKHANRLFS